MAALDIKGLRKAFGGNVIIPELGFDTGAGDDVFILNIDAAGNALAQNTGISTGTGEDVVVVTATGGTVQGVVDVDIDTGMNSDQVWVATPPITRKQAVVLPQTCSTRHSGTRCSPR